MNAIFLVPILLSATYVLLEPTLSFFNDVETSQGDTISIATWKSHGECLQVNANDAYYEGKTLGRITVFDSCEQPIVLVGLRAGWQADNGERVIGVQVADNGTSWSGAALSGYIIDIDDTFLASSATHGVSLSFDSDMAGKSFSLAFLMGDRSIKEISVNIPAVSNSSNGGDPVVPLVGEPLQQSGNSTGNSSSDLSQGATEPASTGGPVSDSTGMQGFVPILGEPLMGGTGDLVIPQIVGSGDST